MGTNVKPLSQLDKTIDTKVKMHQQDLRSYDTSQSPKPRQLV